MTEDYFEAAQRIYKLIEDNENSPENIKKTLKEGYERVIKLARSKDFIIKAASRSE